MSLFSPLHDCTNIGNKQCVGVLLKNQSQKADTQIFNGNTIINKNGRGAEFHVQTEYSQQARHYDLYRVH
uniref:Uncharacterized protein n=1 Tax=Pseudoalteromonas rubra TaxID=43658 RepID=A0A0F4QRA9_9GAMM|nr:hypothetical protein TW77_08400 [Pseudoalteromonas rubra]